MGRYDEEIVALVKQGGLTDTEIARRVGTSRATVWAAKKRAKLTTPKPAYDVKILPIVPEVKHQAQYGYIMLKALERRINGYQVTDKTSESLDGFVRNLERKVWIYEPNGEGFRQITRREEHKNYPFYPPPKDE